GEADDPAGAYVDGLSAERARARGVDPHRCLADNNSTAFFAVLKDLISPGPTFTNVNDFRAIMVNDVDTP
ncbi:MAG: MOFRL family protein, partial [Pseudorhodoplanes sp.]